MIHIPETKLIPLGDIVLDSTNPNAMSDAKFKALKDNIERYGFLVPIITNKSLKIADGFHRWKAARDLGMEEVPTLVLDVDEVDRRLLRQIMNKLKGSHDEQKDFDEWQWLKDNDAEDLLNKLLPEEDWGMMGLVEEPEVTDDNFDVEKKEQKYDVQPGQIYKLGNHRLMCGDSTDADCMARLMGGHRATMAFTDPPYNTGMTAQTQSSATGGTLWKGNKKNNNGSAWLSHMFDDAFTDEQWASLLDGFTTQLYNFTAPDSMSYICLDWRRNHELVPYIKKHWKYSNLIIWDKMVHGLGSDYQYCHEFINVCRKGKPEILNRSGEKEYYDIWHIQRKLGRDDDHATKKPIELVSRAIRHASRKGESVLDLFGGSGSTLIACEQLGRHCYMMELMPEYVSTTIERWEKLTGQKAELIE